MVKQSTQSRASAYWSASSGLFRKPPAPEFAELSQRIGDLHGQLDKLLQIAALEYNTRCAREIRELLAEPRYAEHGRLERHGRKVWSQNDEDGILEEIFRRIGTASRGGGTFVEFGVSHGRECNTLKLLVEGWAASDGRRGMCIGRVCRATGRRPSTEAGQREAENINQLTAGARFPPPSSTCRHRHRRQRLLRDEGGRTRPRVLLVEYNGKYPPPDLVPRHGTALGRQRPPALAAAIISRSADLTGVPTGETARREIVDAVRATICADG